MRERNNSKKVVMRYGAKWEKKWKVPTGRIYEKIFISLCVYTTINLPRDTKPSTLARKVFDYEYVLTVPNRRMA